MSAGPDPFNGRLTAQQPLSKQEQQTQIGAVVVVYTNYRGETALRKIVPKRIWFGNTEWHPEDGWLLDAYDIEKGAERSFAMKDIRLWLPELK